MEEVLYEASIPHPNPSTIRMSEYRSALDSETFRNIRKERRLSLEDVVATKIISYRQLDDLETGRTTAMTIRFGTLQQLADFYECDIDVSPKEIDRNPCKIIRILRHEARGMNQKLRISLVRR